MFKTSLLCGAALIASVGLAAGAGTPESAIPNFSAAAFGWQPITFLDFEPIAGKVAPIGPDPTYSPGRGIERLSDAENPNLKPWAAPRPAAATAPSTPSPAAGRGAVRANCYSSPSPSTSFKRRKRSGSSGSGTSRCAASISTASTAKIQSRVGSASP